MGGWIAVCQDRTVYGVNPHRGSMKKKCTKCRNEKPFSEFYKFKKGKDGLRPMCKSCFSSANKQYRAIHKEEAKLYAKQYQFENAEKIAAAKANYYQKNKSWVDKKNKQYAIDNKDEIAEWMKKYNIENRDDISRKKKIGYLENREETLIKCREYYTANKDDVKKRVKKYADNNKEKVSMAQKKYRDANHEIILIKNKEWREKNKEQIRSDRKIAYNKNPIPSKVRAAKRRASKIKATPKWYSYTDVAPIYRTAKAMSAGSDIWHVDHIIPLTHPLVCGLHCKDNLQIITAEKNLRKNNTFEIPA